MIDPRGLTVQQWADAVVLATGNAWSYGRLDNPANWQAYMVGFVRASPFTQRVLPDPYQFDDWREWAMRAYPMLEGTG